MRASTILLVTFLIWITAKGRLQDYWKLAIDNVPEEAGNIGPGDNSSHAGGSPGFSLDNWLNKLENDFDIDINIQ